MGSAMTSSSQCMPRVLQLLDLSVVHAMMVMNLSRLAADCALFGQQCVFMSGFSLGCCWSAVWLGRALGLLSTILLSN
jgi:hypothetical protein